VLTPPDNSDHNVLMLADLYEDHGLTNLADEVRSEVLSGASCNQWNYEYNLTGIGSDVGGGVGGTGIGVGAGGIGDVGGGHSSGGSIGGNIGVGVGGLGVRRQQLTGA
jgi:hypothetical protein